MKILFFYMTRLLLCSATWSFSVAAMAQDNGRLPDFDKRRESPRQPMALAPARQAGIADLRARVPGVSIEIDDVLVSPKFIHNRHGLLSGPASANEILDSRVRQALQEPEGADPREPFKVFLNENETLFGYDANILNSAQIVREHITEHNGMRTVVWEQGLDGIPIFEGVLYGQEESGSDLRKFFYENGLRISLTITGVPAFDFRPRERNVRNFGLLQGP